EALWLCFSSVSVPGHFASYPFAVKVAAGKVNAVTGRPWSEGLGRQPHDYLVTPPQPWLDGYCVEKGYVRQFVAMPLGAGYTAEEQLTHEAEHGGLQLLVYPMRREAFERRFPRRRLSSLRRHFACRSRGGAASAEMGMAPGGKMRQEVYKDRYGADDW